MTNATENKSARNIYYQRHNEKMHEKTRNR